MSEAPEIVVGRLVRCHHAQMSRPFIARVCQVFGNRLVVEANDAKTMAIVQCQRRKG